MLRGAGSSTELDYADLRKAVLVLRAVNHDLRQQMIGGNGCVAGVYATRFGNVERDQTTQTVEGLGHVQSQRVPRLPAVHGAVSAGARIDWRRGDAFLWRGQCQTNIAAAA